ncbi:MAG: glycosyltransferase family 2 protein [Bacteroidales bacterium]|nr:glycosyltransferase family 2 protein [Bacteroidales bacterium]
MPSFSIIIPHRNIPLLLSRCLRSIPESDSIQVVVVDDNSDNAEDIPFLVPELKRSNVEYYLTKDGRGAGYARNVGLKYAVGQWLIFADADDFFTDDFLDVISEHMDSSSDIIYFNTQSCQCDDISVKANRTKDFMFERYEAEPDESLFRFGYTEPWSKMIRMSLVVDNGIKFDETKVANDYLFSVMTGYYAKTISIVNHPIYVYTVRSGSLTSDDNSVNLEKLTARLDAFINVQAFMEDKGYSSSPALTSHILVPLFKNYRSVYNRYVHVLRKRGLSVFNLYRDTLCHYIRKSFGKAIQYGDVYSIIWRR